MVLGKDRGDGIARCALGNRDRDLLAGSNLRILTGKEALDGWHDKEGNRSKREHGYHGADNHGHRGALLFGTTASVRVIARARGRSYTMSAMRTMCVRVRLRGLRALRRSLLLKASAASGLRGTSGGLLSGTLSWLSGTRGGLRRTRNRLSRTLRRLHRALACLDRARCGLSLAIGLARVGSARHAGPPRFYDRATSAKTGWQRSCQSCPSSAFR